MSRLYARAAQEGLNAHDLTFDPVVSTSKKIARYDTVLYAV